MPRKKGRRVAKVKKSTGIRYSVEKRAQMVGQKLAGATLPQIQAVHGCSESTAIRILRKQRKTGSVKDLPGRGRKRKTSEREDRHLALEVARDPNQNSTKLAKRIVPTLCKNRISRWTVARRLREYEFGAHTAALKPLLSHDNIEKRLAWAKKHKDWTVDNWKRVLFSDETPFCLFQSFGRKIVWRRKGERYKPDCLVKTVKHGVGRFRFRVFGWS